MGFQFQEWILNDHKTAPFFLALRDIGHTIKVPPRYRREFEKQKQLAADGDQRAIALASWLCFNGGNYGCGGSHGQANGGRRTPEAEERNLRLAHKVIAEHKPRITSLDWLDCLEAEQPGPQDLIVIDGPYLDCKTAVYDPENILPVELIAYLQSHPDLNWVLCEYRQPLYLHAFGEPAYQKEVQLRTVNFAKSKQERRVECVWTSASYKAHLAKTATKVPELLHATLRDPEKYRRLTIPEVLKELRLVADKIEKNKLEVSAEERQRLLPLLIILKKLTKRKKPGYHESLASIGLNASTVRSWFYRGHHTDEIIAMLEPEPEAEPKTEPDHDDEVPERPLSAEAECLQQADKLAAATLRGNVKRARHLALEYSRARKLMLGKTIGKYRSVREENCA